MQGAGSGSSRRSTFEFKVQLSTLMIRINNLRISAWGWVTPLIWYVPLRIGRRVHSYALAVRAETKEFQTASTFPSSHHRIDTCVARSCSTCTPTMGSDVTLLPSHKSPKEHRIQSTSGNRGNRPWSCTRTTDMMQQVWETLEEKR